MMEKAAGSEMQSWPDGRPLPENMRAGAREMADLIENGQLFTFEQRLRRDYNSMQLEDFRAFLNNINENLTEDEKRTNQTLPKLDVLDERYDFHLPLQLVANGRVVGKSVLDQYSRSNYLSSTYDIFKNDYFLMNSCRESSSSDMAPILPECSQTVIRYEQTKAKLPIELHLE